MSRASLSRAIERTVSGSRAVPLRRTTFASASGSVAPLSATSNARRKTARYPMCMISLPQTRSYASPTLKFKQSALSPEEYQKLSDEVFDSLTDYLEEVVQDYDGEGADDYEVEYSSGVLNLRLGEHGTYVINKQPANKQIWFSSPTSGPKRFEYDSKENAWFMLKEGEEWNMRDLLNRELSKIFDRTVEVNLGER